MTARLAFGLAMATLAWTHVAFPIVLILRSRLRARPIARKRWTPSVSVIVAAHDEAAHIADRLDNLAAQDYPADRLEVVVASDGSTDGTPGIAAGRDSVRVLDLPRVGKPAALNAAVMAASGEIIVFTDANTVFDANAIRALTEPFADPSVGGVAGDQRYLPGDDSAGERGHWALDRVLKRAESAAGNAVSATGAIYAIRRALYDPVPPGVTDDFYISTGVVSRGSRLVFAPTAIAWERVAAGDRREYARKVRIITQGLTALLHRRDLFDVRRHGFYSIQLMTHKVLRRLSAVPLLVIAVSTALMAPRDRRIRALLAAQTIVYGLGIAGIVGGRRVAHVRALTVPAFFCMVNAAAIHALLNVARGRRIDRWQPTHAGKRPRP